MEIELKKVMLRSGIPQLFLREGASLSKYAKSGDNQKVAETLYNITGPDYLFKDIIEDEEKNFIYLCGQGDIRDIWFLFARALVLQQEDVNVVPYVEISRILKTRVSERTQEEAELLEMCDHCQFLFLDDFEDSGFEAKRRTDHELMMWYIRRKLEKGGVVVTYGDVQLSASRSWPTSFIQYLKYRAHLL